MLNRDILRKLSELSAEERLILSGHREIDRSLYMDGRHDVITGDKLLKKGQSITIRPHTRFVRFPEHSHDYVEMVYMCQGETKHTINGQKMTLREGELLMLGQSARQEIEAAGEADIAVNVIVRPEFFGGVLALLEKEETPLRRFLLDSLCGGSEPSYLYFRVADILPIQNLVENLLYTLISETPNKRGILQMTMGLLFAQLMNHTGALTFESRENAALVHTLRYIEENYRSGSMTELAESLHYEASSLSRLVKRKTGKTYTELLQEKRLSQAAWLLHNTDKNVEEISLAVGYENMTYFHRIFSRQFGCSPRKYRLRGPQLPAGAFL